ncbi:MAG: hypothetical protein ACHQ9S_26965 [Candidatus Binatia bacterium]
MASRTTVTANDLVAWASRMEAQSLLPVLMRRLVFATGEGLQRVGFPAHESVQLGGWDGIVLAGAGDQFVPAGASAWEMGVTATISTKANGDYAKRTANPLGVNPSESTFVFVTPRKWDGKEQWIRDRIAEGKWREVRAYDADDIELWLERAPAPLFWFAELIGLRVDDAWELGSHWLDWTASTSPPLSPQVVLAGRDAPVKAIQEWIGSNRPTLAVAAESRQEALAVFEAVIALLPSDERDRVQSRTLVVGSDSAWQRLARFDRPLVLIPSADGLEIGAALRRNHRVVVPCDRAGTPNGAEVVSVGRPSRTSMREALLAMGIAREKTDDLAALGRRNLLALRRRMSAAPGALRPAWLGSHNAAKLIPLLLLGSWNSGYQGDTEAVEQLSGVGYAEIEDLLLLLAAGGDPPGRKVGAVWRAVSREELWDGISPLLSDNLLGKYLSIAVAVLSQPDELIGKDFAQQLAASFHNEKQPFSSQLRHAVAESLAFLGTHGTNVPASSTKPASDIVRQAVRKALTAATTTVSVWNALQSILTDLAEAAPEEVLGALEGDLKAEKPLLIQLFTDKEYELFGSSPHTGLLWSLERLAWSSTYLPRAAMLLARLARLDPGGKLTNRPRNSLTGIFRILAPGTSATALERFAALDLIRKEEPGAAWDLLTSLLPEMHGSWMVKARPKWRDWAEDTPESMTWAEYHKVLEGVVSRLLVDVGPPGPRWKRLLEALPHLPLPLQERVLGQFEALAVEPVADADREAVQLPLRDLLSRHRSVATKDHRLPDEVLDRLDRQLDRFRSESMARRYAWLFAHWPHLPAGHLGDMSSRQEAIRESQEEAVRTIHSATGLAGLIDTAKLAERPDLVGYHAGRLALIADIDPWLGEQLSGTEWPAVTFARGYVEARFSLEGWPWVESTVELYRTKWSPKALSAFLSSLPSGGKTWDLVEALGTEVEVQFWSQGRVFGLEKPEECQRAARLLGKHGRPIRAIELLALYIQTKGITLDPNLVDECLEGALKVEASDEQTGLAGLDYSVGLLLDFLTSSGAIVDARLAQLEWAWLPLFRFGHRPPSVLHGELARTPSFFVELVQLAYRGDDEEPETLDKRGQARAMTAYDLIEHWRTVPGLDKAAAGTGPTLDMWVKEARHLLSQSKRSAVGDLRIGHLLSGSPAGADGIWPHEAVRDVIEAVGSEDLEAGFSTGLYNSRGVVTKDLLQGGEQERSIAEHYEKQASGLEKSWPRTAALVRSIAEGYRRDAKREDLDAEYREDL